MRQSGAKRDRIFAAVCTGVFESGILPGRGEASEKSRTFLECGHLKYDVGVLSLTLYGDGHTGAHKIPNGGFEVVTDTTRDANYLVALLNVPAFVFKAAIAGIEVCPDCAFPIGAHEEVHVFSFVMMGEKVGLAVGDELCANADEFALRNNDLVLRGLAATTREQRQKQQSDRPS